MNLGVIIAVVLVAGIGLLFMVNGKPKKSKSKGKYSSPQVDKATIREKWSQVEATFSLGGPSNFKSAIMEADKLVDFALVNLRVPGDTMGERLKSAKGKFRDYNDYNNLWFAHKVRNNIAHEVSHELNSAEAKKAMDYFRKALNVLGVL